ncbi:hypothetical protein BZA77DRAFT_82837 [Pyronema omphalodes]|nr:hypothetical protein BZA77DRAFT_82837 [Pyronema omphalodes]
MSSTSIPPQTQPGKKLPPPEHVTIREHDWAYAALQMIFDPPYKPEIDNVSWPPDILTWRSMLTSALTQFLGVTGSAISIDILHLDGDEAWLRIPRVDLMHFKAGVSGYVGFTDGRNVGFRTIGTSEFLMGLASKKAEDSIWTD